MMAVQRSEESERTMNEIDEALPTDIKPWALFLDIDGTLIDIAETPGDVFVPPELPDQLAKISASLDGALALVSGRSIDTIDELFGPYQFPAAGLHGTEIRYERYGRIDRSIGDEGSLNDARRELEGLAKKWSGMIVEDKRVAIAVHYRQVPEAVSQVDAYVERLLVQLGRGWTRQDGSMVVEIHPSETNKGTAIAKLMSVSPFSGRSAIAIGDDLTDEMMFEFVNRTGGRSIKVGTSAHKSVAKFQVNSASNVRHWILQLARYEH
jgi:trehalose 6-phosphate phosphatase